MILGCVSPHQGSTGLNSAEPMMEDNELLVTDWVHILKHF
jgi:hypothetical protein